MVRKIFVRRLEYGHAGRERIVSLPEELSRHSHLLRMTEQSAAAFPAGRVITSGSRLVSFTNTTSGDLDGVLLLAIPPAVSGSAPSGPRKGSNRGFIDGLTKIFEAGAFLRIAETNQNE